MQWRMRDDNANEWIWTPRAQRRHDLSEWMAVDLPMSVQEALWRARQIPDPYRDLNSRAVEWIEHRDWVFGLDFDMAPHTDGRRVFLEFESVADVCMLYLNGTLVGKHEGPGAPFDFEIGRHLRDDGSNQMFLVVRAPHQEDPQTGWTERTRSLRGRMGFGWDFAPRLVSIGVLGDVAFRHTGAHRLRDLWARPYLSDDLREAAVTLSVRVDGPTGAEVRFSVSQGRRGVAQESVVAGANGQAIAVLDIPRPRVWWPNGLGGQPLYAVRAECADGSDSVESVFGLRNVEWEVRSGGDGEWPLMLAVNGRHVFQRGWNWVPADCMGGPRALPVMRRLVRLAREADANVLRCWGGADPETQAFYDECDRAGVLVWQEFPLSSSGISNVPPDDTAYLGRMEAYARDVVTARRNHPSLALWGGGNELSGYDGKPLTLDHPYAERLQHVIHEHDPGRDFRPSSPLGPTADADPEHPVQLDVHGPWEYSQRYPGPQYWRINDITPALHSELGAPGVASLQTQRRYLSPRHRSRNPANPAWSHHGGAWWDHSTTVEQLFGPIEDDEMAMLTSQWLQAEALRYYVEETRRRWPRSGGIYPWQLNEPWPNMACTSAVEYTGRTKLAYHAVRQAYRPTAATAHYSGLTIAPGEPLRAEIWAHNYADSADADLLVTLRDPGGRELVPDMTRAVSLPTNASRKLLDVETPLPQDYSGIVLLELTLAGKSSRYIFSNAPQPWLRPALDYPEILKGMFESPHG